MARPVDGSSLDELLKEAGIDAARRTPIRKRTALFLIIDYYQSILVEAARRLGRELRGGLPLDAMNVIFAAIPDYSGEEIGRLEGLRKLRNSLDHKVEFIPNGRVIAAYLDGAKETRTRLLAAADKARLRLDSMSEVPRMFAEAAMAMREVDTQYWPNEEAWIQKLLERADEIAATQDPSIGAEDVEAYADLRTAAKEAASARDADYEDMAMSAAYDQWRGK